jgi:hypothetical protein
MGQDRIVHANGVPFVARPLVIHVTPPSCSSVAPRARWTGATSSVSGSRSHTGADRGGH